MRRGGAGEGGRRAGRGRSARWSGHGVSWCQSSSRAGERRDRAGASKHDEAKQSFLDEGLLILSLAQEAPALFEQATREEKRELLNHLLSNASWAGGKLAIEWRKPYVYLAEFQDPGSDEPPFGGESEGGPSEMVGLGICL